MPGDIKTDQTVANSSTLDADVTGVSRLERTREERKRKIAELEAMGVETYQPVASPTHSAKQAGEADGLAVTVAGRILAWRGHGKIQFADLHDQTGKIQLAFRVDDLSPEQFSLLSHIDIGDFLEAQGETFTTKAGERTVQVKNYTILSKAITPPPAKHQDFKDKEERLRKRYLDLILNPEVKQTLDKRWAITQAVRQFLWGQG